MPRLADDDLPQWRSLVVGLSKSLQYVNGRTDRAERIAELVSVSEHSQELVFRTIRVLNTFQVQCDDVLVLAPQALAHLESKTLNSTVVWDHVGQAPKLRALDLEDDTGV